MYRVLLLAYFLFMFVFAVKAEYGPEGKNLTLTCLLTCAGATCDQDFNLTWTGNSKGDWQSSLITVNNTLISKLLITDIQTVRDTFACSMYREGVEMAAKKWPSSRSKYVRFCYSIYSLQTSTHMGYYMLVNGIDLKLIIILYIQQHQQLHG